MVVSAEGMASERSGAIVFLWRAAGLGCALDALGPVEAGNGYYRARNQNNATEDDLFLESMSALYG
jgi:hypothetical protein